MSSNVSVIVVGIYPKSVRQQNIVNCVIITFHAIPLGGFRGVICGQRDGQRQERQMSDILNFSLRRRQKRFFVYKFGNFLSCEFRELYIRGLSGRGVKLTAHLHLVSRLRMMELHFHSPVRLHDIVLNYTGLFISP
jgi:hypothetical protein